jgi:hypothetical protein
MDCANTLKGKDQSQYYHFVSCLFEKILTLALFAVKYAKKCLVSYNKCLSKLSEFGE